MAKFATQSFSAFLCSLKKQHFFHFWIRNHTPQIFLLILYYRLVPKLEETQGWGGGGGKLDIFFFFFFFFIFYKGDYFCAFLFEITGSHVETILKKGSTLKEKQQQTIVVCFFILTNHRLERRLYVKLKDWMLNSVDPDLDLRCLQKPNIIVCSSERVNSKPRVLTLCMLGKNFSRRHFELFFHIFPRKLDMTIHVNCL